MQSLALVSPGDRSRISVRLSLQTMSRDHACAAGERPLRLTRCWIRFDNRGTNGSCCRFLLIGIVNLSGTPITWQSCGMDASLATTTYESHRFSVEIISYAAWLYFRFCLSRR